MDTELKVPIITGVSVLLLSMLIGIVSKVGFGYVVVKALILSLVFSAAAFGITRIVIPFLLSGQSDPSSAAAAAVSAETDPLLEAHSVNIVLPGGNEIDAQDSLVGEPMGRDFERSDIDSGEDLVSDLEKEAVDAGNESLLPEEESGDSAASSIARPPAVFEDLDVLPDLDGFAGTFEGSSGTADESPAVGSVNRSASPEVGSYADGTNPSEIAMAIRTILKKDQKG